MRLSAPKKTTWWVAIVLGAVGIIAKFGFISFLTGFAFWLVVAAFVILALATYLKGF